MSDYTVAELRKQARQKGLSGYSKLRKSELVKLLKKTSSKRCAYGVKKDGGCKKKPGPRSKRSRRHSSKRSGKTKIAFCFLLYDTIQHLDIWENFFSQDIDGSSMVYSHLKTVTNKTPGWVKKAKVPTVETNWCGEGLINAFVRMLKKALKDPNNKYFALLSGSCIPLYNYSETYKKITSTSKARIEYDNIPYNVFENRKGVYNGHQWVILNRDVATQYIRLYDPSDVKAKKFIKKFRNIYKENGISVGRKKAVKSPEHTWLGGCPDEIYPINWFVEVYGKNLSKHIKKQMTTYTSWDFDKDPDHPEVFNIRTVKKAKREICARGHIFARKFTYDAAKYIAMKCGKGYAHSSSHSSYQKKEPVIVRKELVGRLGNQMFQYAAALGIAARKHGDACIITDDDLISYDELRRESDDLINVCKGPFKICGRPDYDFTLIPELGHARYDIGRFLVPGSIEIETDMDQGFLQSYKYFENIEGVIRKKFAFKGPIARRVTNYMKKMRKDRTKVIGLHARRGDHLELGFMRFPSKKYFTKARDYFRKKYSKVKFIVATNDRKWAQEYFDDYDTEVITHSKSAPEDLAILGACDGVIMSLGTFSWWGAWLCNGPVVYYKNEFVMSDPINRGRVRKSDYYPPKWVALS